MPARRLHDAEVENGQSALILAARGGSAPAVLQSFSERWNNICSPIRDTPARNGLIATAVTASDSIMPSVAELIANALNTGLVHPGDPAKGVKPKPIALPFGRKASMPQEYSDLMDATVKLLSEAIVALIEEEHEIVPREEAVVMRRAVGEGPPHPLAMGVHCKCRDEPLVMVPPPSNDRIVLDGKTLIRQVSKLDARCPHERKP
jgi:hypothetical protein